MARSTSSPHLSLRASSGIHDREAAPLGASRNVAPLRLGRRLPSLRSAAARPRARSAEAVPYARAAGSLLLLLLAVPAARADDPIPYERQRLYGTLSTYIRAWDDTSPEDKAAKRFRMPFLQVAHVGSGNVGVPGMTVEAMGYGEIESFEPIVGNMGRADLLYAMVTWRGLPDDMLFMKGGRQIIHIGAGSNAIIDGLSVHLDVPLKFTLEGWGGWTADPGFGESRDAWQYGARVAWNPFDVGHVGVSFAQERIFGEPSRELVGLDFAWRQFRFFDFAGYAYYDNIAQELQELELYAESYVTKEWRVHGEYRHFNPDARIPKTSIFSVFTDRTAEEAGGSIGFFPRTGLLALYAGVAALIYGPDDLGLRAMLRPRLMLNRKNGNLVGLEGSRIQNKDNGYWSVRGYGVWSPWPLVHLTADAEGAFYDHDIDGHGWSNVSRLTASFDVFDGARVLGDASVVLSPTFKQEWVGMLRFTYDLSGKNPEPVVTP